MTDGNRLLDVAIHILEKAQLADRPGILLYSGSESLSKGDLYLLGANPGGRIERTIRQSIADSKGGQNEYLDAAWGRHRGRPGELRDIAGAAPMQKRVRFILGWLGYDTRFVAASNVVFVRSTCKKNLPNFAELAEMCWPVHMLFLEEIQPRAILCQGNTPFTFISSKLEHRSRMRSVGAQWGNWKCNAVDGRLGTRDIRLISLPHLSRYEPSGRSEMLTWLRHQANETAASNGTEAT